jgi:DNA-binding HxlR family transcriptional regulator
MTMSIDVTCSIAAALGEIGERWSLLIIREAIMGSTRFDQFHQRLGVARNILTQRLATLVEQGVMTRAASPHNARIHHYRLTPKGLDLLPVLAALMQWGDRWVHAGIGPPILLVDRRTGEPIRQIDLSLEDGTALTRADIAILPGPGATPTMRERLDVQNGTEA